MYNLQKQPPEVFCKKKVFLKSRNIQMKTTALESLFNKVERDVRKRGSNKGVFL